MIDELMSFGPCGRSAKCSTPQVDREDADITAWQSDCPDMSEHNSRDCAALISITVNEKQHAALYRDLPCMLPVEDIQVQLLLLNEIQVSDA